MDKLIQDTNLLHQVMIVDGFGLPSELPPAIARNANALRQLYPQAEYRLWDGNSVRDIISANFEPEVLEAFETLRPYSYKCNVARYCLLYLYGGLYVDLGILCINPLQPPPDAGVAAFRDLDFLSPCWFATSTSVIWARPERREFRIALDYILENCRNKYYGKNPLYVSGPVVWGRALAAAKAEKQQQADADDQWIGVCRPGTPGQKQENVCFIAPDQSLTALRVKGTGGDLNHLSTIGTNNYNIFWRSRRVYGEKKACWPFDNSAIFLTGNAQRTQTGITSKLGATGRLIFGPYIPLEPGSYRLSISLSRSRSGTLPQMRVEVAHDCGKQLHLHEINGMDCGAPQTIEFEFMVSTPVENAEFRFETFGEFEAEITQYTLERL